MRDDADNSFFVTKVPEAKYLFLLINLFLPPDSIIKVLKTNILHKMITVLYKWISIIRSSEFNIDCTFKKLRTRAN